MVERATVAYSLIQMVARADVWQDTFSMSSFTKPILVVAGVGNGEGTGGASAREFSKAGYRVALLARNAEVLNKLAAEINNAGGDAHAFPLTAYDYAGLHSAFVAIRAQWPGAPIRVAVFNAGDVVWKPFLQVTEEDVKRSVDTNVVGAFAFSREVILAFKDQELDEVGKRGALIFSSATAAIRGNKTTSAFAAGKFALRSLSESCKGVWPTEYPRLDRHY